MKAPSPWRLVLATDLLIVAVSCFLTFTFSPTVRSVGSEWLFTPLAQGIVCFLAYVIWMPAVHAYRYIVRLSVVEDMNRLVGLVTFATMSLLALAGVSCIMGYPPYPDLWNIFLVMLMSFTMLMMVRLSIKYIYRQIFELHSRRTRVIALGTNINSFSFATNLNNDPERMFTTVAMISLNPEVNFKSVNNVPVHSYDPDNLDYLFSKYDCSTLLFSSSQLEFVRKELADVFLEHNIRLNMYSQVEEIDPATGLKSNEMGSIRSIHIEDLLGRDVIKTDTSNVEGIIRGQVVMVTGAAGSIGSELVNQIAVLKATELVLVDQAETPMHELELQMKVTHPDTQIHLIVADVTNSKRMEQVFAKYRPRYVFHAAAYKHVPMMERNPGESILTNVFGTRNIADLSVKYGVEKFVMISTDKAVNPTNVMGASKRIAEIYVQSLFYHNMTHSDKPATQFVTTRFGNVLGSNGSVIPLFRKQIEDGGPLTVTHRDIIRYFMTIPEACSLVLQAATMGHGGEIFVFDMGEPVRIYDLATRMISLSGYRPGIDIKIIETGLRPGEKLYEELLNDHEQTIATNHSKIMVAKVRRYKYGEVCEHLARLEELTEQGLIHDIVAEMKYIVPEFKSNNSKWESIDREVAEKKR